MKVLCYFRYNWIILISLFSFVSSCASPIHSGPSGLNQPSDKVLSARLQASESEWRKLPIARWPVPLRRDKRIIATTGVGARAPDDGLVCGVTMERPFQIGPYGRAGRWIIAPVMGQVIVETPATGSFYIPAAKFGCHIPSSPDGIDIDIPTEPCVYHAKRPLTICTKQFGSVDVAFGIQSDGTNFGYTGEDYFAMPSQNYVELKEFLINKQHEPLCIRLGVPCPARIY